LIVISNTCTTNVLTFTLAPLAPGARLNNSRRGRQRGLREGGGSGRKGGGDRGNGKGLD